MRSFLIFVFILVLVSGCGHRHISDYSASNLSIDSTNESHLLDSLILPYKKGLDEQMNRVIGQSDSTLTKFQPESPLGNFTADILINAALNHSKSKELGATEDNMIALLNFGGLRTILNRGEITVRNIYELMPFDNRMVIVQISASNIDSLLNYMYRWKGQPVANCQMKLSSEQKSLDVNGIPYPKNQSLFIITSDYLAGGGDDMTFLNAPISYWDSGIFIRDLFIDHIEEKKRIEYVPVEERIILEE